MSLHLPAGMVCRSVTVTTLRTPPGLSPTAVNPPSDMHRIAPQTESHASVEVCNIVVHGVLESGVVPANQKRRK